MNELNSLGNPGFLHNSGSATELAQQQTGSQGGADVVLDEVAQEIVEQFRLSEILEEACLATGATGAAIALARGEEMVCRATTGADAPDLGVCLDPHSGLSGACIQTRQLQQCSDTETDPRVDSEACRQLGVRSILVLPLMNGDQLRGVFEILSSRPNAFCQLDLDSLKALSTGVLQGKGQDANVAAEIPKDSRSLPNFEEDVAQNESHGSDRDRVIPRPKHASQGKGPWTPILGVLVIGMAILLGTVVGWRLGWQKATRQLRNTATPQPVNAQSKAGDRDDIVLPAVELPPSSGPVDDSRRAAVPVTTQKISSAPKNRPHPPVGGVTIHQGGKVIFPAQPSSSPPAGDSQPSQRPSGPATDPSQ
jgi:putative methionine-R-sulfoxide reductase with GAF domain